MKNAEVSLRSYEHWKSEKEYHGNLYQFDNLEETDKFLEKYNLPNWHSKKRKILIASYLLTKLKPLSKIFPQRKLQVPKDVTIKFYQIFKYKIIETLPNYFRKKEEETLLNSFYEVCITSKPKPDKHNMRKL